MKCFNYLSISLLVLLTACSGHTRFYTNQINQVPVNISIERFDQDVFAMDTVQLRQKYGNFMDLYCLRVLPLRNVSQLPLFVGDSAVSDLYNRVQQQYSDVSDIEKELTQAFRYYRYYFPDKLVPQVRLHISGFNQNVVSTDSVVSASVEEYLGADCPDYQYVAYQYELPFMTRSFLPLDLFYGWLTTEFDETTLADSRLLDEMLYYGRLVYLQQVCFPDRPVCELLRYTPQQYEWCCHFEKELWAYLLEEKLLFSSDRLVMTRYLQPAPFTSGLAEESPGRLGVFFGWRIVSAYMDRMQDVDLQGMMALNDAQDVLRQSAYRP